MSPTSYEGPEIARVAALIGDPARARTLTALMAGRALTATELANAAGVTKATISAHLQKLRGARLLTMQSQGRHRYFRLANAEVALLLEQLMGVAARNAFTPPQSGPTDQALRKARVCYDHLAGELGVFVFDRLSEHGALTFKADGVALTDSGAGLFATIGVNVPALASSRRVLCRACLDWSERRSHLAGALGAAFLQRVLALRWARAARDSRVVRFSPVGERQLRAMFR